MPKKSKKQISPLLLLAVLTAALLAFGWTAVAEEITTEAGKKASEEAAKDTAKRDVASKPLTIYDKNTDLLTVDVREIPLKVLLGKIAILSGVEIEMDSSVDQPISIAMEDRRLEDGLGQIARVLGLNHAMIYQKEEGAEESAETTLIYMKIVPKVASGKSNLVPVIALEHEAFIRSKPTPEHRREESPPTPTMFDYARQRWEARMENLPEEERERLEEKTQEQLDRLERKKQKKVEQRAEHEKKRAEREAKRQAKDEELKATNPERYELKMQRREEIRQKVTEEIMQESPPQ